MTTEEVAALGPAFTRFLAAGWPRFLTRPPFKSFEGYGM